MNTCKECVDFIIDYLDGNLDPCECQKFEQHLEKCPPCLCYLESYRETIQIAREAGRDPAPKPVPEELIQAILAARRNCCNGGTPRPPEADQNTGGCCGG